jgi:hypothetical protein
MTVTGGQKILATHINTIETATQERVATTILTADSSTWDDTPEVAATSVTATLVSGQKYKIWFHGRASTDVANDTAGLRIREDAGVAGTQLGFTNHFMPTTTGNGFTTTVYAEYTAAASGSKTFSLTGQRTAGTGVAHRIRAAASSPAFLAIDKVVS